ncbi:YeiH family protein [Lutibaculum baratangense]|uniref:Putative membrane protein YeiH n=1 Tax=Lutibaculum baratangense AMV1 TaxID=631454 RepID=V4RMB3_9HYPH|nr:YeiH family protein [Lutibaculum baratangense]ESR27166.1 putative membrane protein YeiH [Lutibaculum baratangense AMV1]
MPRANSAGRGEDIAGAAVRGVGGGLSLWPGLTLTTAIAALAYFMCTLPGLSNFSPLIVAILIGMTIRNVVGVPPAARAGLAFSQRPILRFAIVLLGLRLTWAQLVELGGTSLAIVVVALAATFVFTLWMGRVLRVERKLATLIAAGTSICGASAVVATSQVAGGRDEDVAYAVACVTLFGTIAMFLYPLLPGLLHLDPSAFGLWAGASIHEVAQVVGAAFQNGATSGEHGTVAKLGRVLMLAPVLLILAATAYRQAGDRKAAASAPFPWFVLGFVALVAFSSVVEIPASVKAPLVELTGFLLAIALAALGLGADIAKIRLAGPRPLALAALSTVFIAVTSLALIKLAG